ncbi:MAG: antitoxin family protein [Archaeoglobus sp.]|uniref:antitoxin family protein n=1 Tax=Archaeoglobus sp. TaxID=1872626 RepID=UPI001E1A8C1D|nr:antitoxin family protein [Archaeoglobus sp.]MBO8179426.1 antitoxin family protein [Archaeoglobus sp.]
MPKIIEAIYEDGVFKPLEKVELKEGERVRIRIEDRKTKRESFLRRWEPIKLDESPSIEKIKELRLRKYGNIL